MKLHEYSMYNWLMNLQSYIYDPGSGTPPPPPHGHSSPPPPCGCGSWVGPVGSHVSKMYVCMYVRTYVRMYVCMYVCMHRTTLRSSSRNVLLALHEVPPYWPHKLFLLGFETATWHVLGRP